MITLPLAQAVPPYSLTLVPLSRPLRPIGDTFLSANRIGS